MKPIRRTQQHGFNLVKIEVNRILSSNGISMLDLPDTVCFSDWVSESDSDEQIKSIAPDIVWEMLDNAGMDRDLVDSICYPDEDWYK